MANISAIKLPDNSNYDLRASAIPFGIVDSSSTSTAFTVTVPGITALEDGVICMLKNGKVTSASGFTINVNGLGAKPVYSNMAAATADTTIFNVNYTMIFVYDETRVEGGCWICYRGFNSNDNTIGYQIRTGSLSLPVNGATGRYRILFTSPDGTHFVPPTLSTSTNATAKRDVNTAKIDPFGRIVYYSTTTILSAEDRPGTGSLWQQYTFALGYSFNRTGAALTMTPWKPVFVKCAPQSDGSAIIDADTPFVQELPSTEDGKIYIWLGIAYSATNIELTLEHPVYEYKNGGIRQWTNTSKGVTGAKGSGAITVAPPPDTQGAYSIGDITISHSTQEGYKHIPSGGSAGQILGYGGSSGTASWVAKPTYTFSEIDSKPTTISGYGITNAYTKTEVDNLFDELPEPMIFKGSVGTGGTVTSLPTATTDNEGWTYKVITALSSPAAKVGDTVISNGSSWIVIPSGDEPSGTITNIETGIGLTGGPITSSGTIKVKLNSETAITDTSKVYMLGVNSDGYLCTKVSWSDIQTRTSDSGTERTIYLAGGTTATDETGGLSKHAAINAFVSANTATAGVARLNLGNSTASTTAGGKEGIIRLYSSAATYYLDLKVAALSSSNKTITFPNKTGTVALTDDIQTVPSSTGSATTGISIAAHGTGTVIGVQSTTTTASKVTVGSSSTDYGVKSAGSASNWAFEDVACDDITAWSAGSGSGSLTFTMDTTDTKKLKVAFSHSHTAPSLSYTAKTASHVTSGGNGTAPTLGSKVPTVSATDVTVPIKNASASTFVTGTTHTVTDNGHTHTI